jgi:Phage integrase family
MFDLGARRDRPEDPGEPVFHAAYRTTARAMERAVKRAREALRDAGKDAAHLDGYTWHGNRHTFTSRLVMAGVGLRTVKELGGWRTLAMVERYSHLAPAHLAEAVERLVAVSAVGGNRVPPGAELGLHRTCRCREARWCIVSSRFSWPGGLALTGKAVDLKWG